MRKRSVKKAVSFRMQQREVEGSPILGPRAAAENHYLPSMHMTNRLSSLEYFRRYARRRGMFLAYASSLFILIFPCLLVVFLHTAAHVALIQQMVVSIISMVVGSRFFFSKEDEYLVAFLIGSEALLTAGVIR
jgi:uncharacterized membrane protein YbhN (UPF0104 family)